MSPALFVDYGGLRHALVTSRQTERCYLCSGTIRLGSKSYRSRKYGPDGDQTVHYHQKCLVGQIDPTVWDIH